MAQVETKIKRSVNTGNLHARNEDLAGKRVKNGSHTVQYDDNGYATAVVRDGGKSATDFVPTTKANDSATHQEMYQAAASNDWDKVGLLSQGLLTPTERRDEAGNIVYDTTAANAYVQELANEFGYNFNDYIRGKYDAVYGKGAYDGGTDTGLPIYNEYSKHLVDNYNANQRLAAMNGGAVGGTYAPTGLDVSSIFTGGVGLDAGGYTGMMQLLENMYAQNLQAELASLRAGYDSDVAELERQNEIITQEYQKAQNQAAAQNALERQRMGEVALAQGLNTGASGQFALAQSAALQGNLANLETQRAASIADNQLLAAQLLNRYNSDVTRARADINAQLSSALYDEMVRQQTLSAQQQKATRDDVLTLIAGGVMPDAAMLSAADMTQQEALLWQALATNTATAKAKTKTGDGSLAGGGIKVDNMGLTDQQIRTLQEYYGAGVDGLWGAQSYEMAGNKTAQEAWDEYEMQSRTPYTPLDDVGGIPSAEFATQVVALSNVLAQVGATQNIDRRAGVSQNAQAMYDALFDRANEGQRNRLNEILKSYGLM